MEYRFQLVQKEGYLHVRVRGDNVPETVMKYLREIYEACRKWECPRVLVEENLQGPGMTLTEVFGVVNEASRQVWPVVQQVAFVDVNPEHDHKNMKFAETVAVNRAVNIRVFATLADAEAWLRESPPSKP
ncbi:MAG: hypothetical protein HY293_06525 [Planctomycetes bacterium]|nr:hypothetical protein [Planctomycetota bacterium]